MYNTAKKMVNKDILTSRTIKRLLRAQSKIENNFILKNFVEIYMFILIKVFELQG